MGRHGENIHKRKDGRWEARYIQSYRNNRAVYRSVYGKSYREAKEKRSAAVSAENIPTLEKEGTAAHTFEELANAWLESRKGWIKESSYCHYHQMLRLHIVPGLGRKRLRELSSDDIQQYLNSLKNTDHPLSQKSISDIRAVLRMILHYGNRLGVISMVPDQFIIPKRMKSRITVLTREEQDVLESALESTPDTSLSIAVYLALYAGLRVGEVCGLMWGDIRRRDRSIRVCRTVLRIPDLEEGNDTLTKLVIQQPKSEHSARTIPIPQGLYLKLEELRGPDICYVLTGTEEFSEPRSIQKRFQTFMRKNGLQGFSFHSLRHTFATRCVESGMDVKSLSEIMGHASVSTTMQMYVHPSLDTKREQMNKMESWMMRTGIP